MPERNFRKSPARAAAAAAAAAAAENSVPLRRRSPARRAERSPARRTERSPARRSERSPSRRSERSPSRRSEKSPSRRAEKSPSRTPQKQSPSKKSPSERKSPARVRKSLARNVPNIVIPPKEEIIQQRSVVLHNHASGDGLDFLSNVRRSREPSLPSVLRRSTRIAVHEEFEDRLEETKRIEQLKVSINAEVEYPEKLSLKLENHEVKEFGGVFGVLLLQIISQLLLLATHLYCSEVQYGVNNFRIPFDWRVYFDLEVAALYLGFVVLQLVMSIIPVGKLVDGLPDKLGRLKYRNNGLLSAIVTVAILAVLKYFKFTVTIIADKYIQFFVTGLVYAYILALLLYIRGGRAHIVAQNPFAMTGSFIYDFWMGREVNPRIGPFDVKVGLYRTGIIGMIVVNAALILKSLEQSSGYSPTLLLAGGLQIWYALDFLWFEDGFLASFEVMYEGTGYMLALGYNMYPFIPTIITRFVLIYRVEIPLYCLAVIAIVNAIGYVIYRGSNSQKSEFRRNPLNPALAHLETIPTSRGKKILVSGWWGWVRHPNYLGDIIMHWSWASTCAHEVRYF
ncbi:delta(14)-sterol reductase isoform X2 [Zootermopsis nevadensis]|uniref:delta(14)-sterol reductase isoform X2 n=1 Tax=Zootermopsis nevadensis TaxID=136037 RepID=UPI000B8E7B46|nr:delta(14)-sterol reductase isoform X2 [Zootermopsis nevadensis]